MKSFSERMGLVSATPLPILNDASPELRISLYNALNAFAFPRDQSTGVLTNAARRFALAADEFFFSNPVTDLEYYHSDYSERILKWMRTASWNKIFEFVEWSLEYHSKRPSDGRGLEAMTARINSALSRHYSGYRVIERLCVPLSDANELQQVKQSINYAGRFSPVAEHIRSAAELMNPAANPNYRNSVKESISAVEAAAKIITGQEGSTLGPALTWLEKNTGLHPALKTGFSALYGWTSSADGIRHALMDDDKLNFEQAKYMLVACSTFANYLIAEYAKSSGTS